MEIKNAINEEAITEEVKTGMITVPVDKGNYRFFRLKDIKASTYIRDIKIDDIEEAKRDEKQRVFQSYLEKTKEKIDANFNMYFNWSTFVDSGEDFTESLNSRLKYLNKEYDIKMVELDIKYLNETFTRAMTFDMTPEEKVATNKWFNRTLNQYKRKLAKIKR